MKKIKTYLLVMCLSLLAGCSPLAKEDTTFIQFSLYLQNEALNYPAFPMFVANPTIPDSLIEQIKNIKTIKNIYPRHRFETLEHVEGNTTGWIEFYKNGEFIESRNFLEEDGSYGFNCVCIEPYFDINQITPYLVNECELENDNYISAYLTADVANQFGFDTKTDLVNNEYVLKILTYIPVSNIYNESFNIDHDGQKNTVIADNYKYEPYELTVMIKGVLNRETIKSGGQILIDHNQFYQIIDEHKKEDLVNKSYVIQVSKNFIPEDIYKINENIVLEDYNEPMSLKGFPTDKQ